MHNVQLTGVLLIVGSALFLFSAFAMPGVSRIYMESSAAGRIQIVQTYPSTWILHNILFLLGSTITAVALVQLTSLLPNHNGKLWLWLGALFILLAVIPWDWHLMLRLIHPEAFARNALPIWLFPTFTLLTLSGLGMLGMGFLDTPLPIWLAWVHIGGAVLLVLLFGVFRDMPPFVYYLFTLTTGILCLQKGTFALLPGK